LPIPYLQHVSQHPCKDPLASVEGKKKGVTLGNPVAVDTDGLLMDVDVQSINNAPPIHLCTKINAKMLIIFFKWPLSKMSRGSQKNITPVNYAHKFLTVYLVAYIDMGCLGTKRVSLMKLQPYNAILRRIIQYMICSWFYTVF